MDAVETERLRSLKYLKLLFAALALICATGALAVLSFNDELGLPNHSGWIVATGLFIVAVMTASFAALSPRVLAGNSA